MQVSLLIWIGIMASFQDNNKETTKRDEAVQRLQDLGANVENLNDGVGIYFFDPVDDEIFDNLVKAKKIRSVSFDNDTNPSDQQLLRLQVLTELKTFSMSRWAGNPGSGLRFVEHLEKLEEVNCAATDVGVEQLKTAKGLKRLNLCYAPISNASMKSIGQINSLERIDLLGVEISGGLEMLTDLSNLKELSFEDTKVNDESLIAFLAISKSKTKLQSILLGGTSVSDNSMERISEATSLRVLGLSSTKVSSKGLRELVKCPRLESLFVDGIELGTGEVDAICEMKALKDLWVSKANLRDLDGKRIERVLPKCQIYRLK